MSRSAPNANSNPNPATHWFEWRGGEGTLSFYEKETKTQVSVPTPFKFMVLDQLSTASGYNKKLKSGIFANEVRDVRTDVLKVKFFNGEEIASGLWKDIKEKVNFKQGSFATSCYIAFKEDDILKIGNLRISGCALGPWIDFVKANRSDIDAKGVVLKKGPQDTSGSVHFYPPVFEIMEISDKTNSEATALDKSLQVFLKGYLAKNVTAGASEEDHSQEPPAGYGTESQEREPDPEDLRGSGPKVGEPEDDSSIPFAACVL